MARAVEPADESEARAAVKEIGLPCIVKPGKGDLWFRRSGSKLQVARTADEAVEWYRAMRQAGVSAILQELIPGGDDSFFGCFCYIDQAGEVRASFTKRKLRQHPANFGNGSYQVSVDSPETAELALVLLEKIGYRGVASVEFKRDPRDGKLKLIEINCRAASGTQMAIDAGVDLPWLVYRDLVGDPLPPVSAFRAGCKFINLSWDAQRFWESGERNPVGFARWAWSVLRADSHAALSLRDPGPAFSLVKRMWSRPSKAESGPVEPAARRA